MTPERFSEITGRYAKLRIAVVGDFCLDRYLDIDPARSETSIETGLPVHNVVGVRSQPGAAGTILANLIALGAGTVLPVGFCGEDGEGYELLRALKHAENVKLDGFVRTPERRTFSYTKPLVHEPGIPPRELSRLDLKNWSPTPPKVEEQLLDALHKAADEADAIIVMDQVDVGETGVITSCVRDAIGIISRENEARPVLGDCRRGLAGWPACIWKMNAHELSVLSGAAASDRAAIESAASELAKRNRRPVFVTIAADGIIGADAGGATSHVPTHPLRGPIDIVGAGDSVSANLAMALAAGASISEAMEIAMAAASLVIHQVGTTGSASPREIGALILGTR